MFLSKMHLLKNTTDILWEISLNLKHKALYIITSFIIFIYVYFHMHIYKYICLHTDSLHTYRQTCILYTVQLVQEMFCLFLFLLNVRITGDT